jgi:hypothetical protein
VVAFKMKHVCAPCNLPGQGDELVQIVGADENDLGSAQVGERFQGIQLDLESSTAGRLADDMRCLVDNEKLDLPLTQSALDSGTQGGKCVSACSPGFNY